jgi:formate dehydrogenase subunit gamma
MEILRQGVRQAVTDVVVANKQMPGALLPILHGIQDTTGCISAEGVEIIVRELNRRSRQSWKPIRY